MTGTKLGTRAYKSLRDQLQATLPTEAAAPTGRDVWEKTPETPKVEPEITLESLGEEDTSHLADTSKPATSPENLTEGGTPNLLSTTHKKGPTSPLEEKALTLLGSGINQEQVASALGVTPARITQLLSNPEFARQVSDLRYAGMQAHNERDAKYDKLEDKLISKLESALPLCLKPETILSAIKVVSSVKRRGQSAPQAITNQQTVVQLVLPNVIVDKFTTNSNNQVIRAGEQELETMVSGNLLDRVEAAQALKEKENEQLTDHTTEQLTIENAS